MNKILKALSVWSDHYICIYGCGFTGTYAEVQAHQSSVHGYGS